MTQPAVDPSTIENAPLLGDYSVNQRAALEQLAKNDTQPDGRTCKFCGSPGALGYCANCLNSGIS
jgi:hypothetical protein